eukprot:COSAG01_NODE_34048_length_554_cov_1.342857_1_plen_113_part_00
MRESLHDYIMAAMDKVSQTGLPINRPLWFDFPADANTWEIKDEYHLRNIKHVDQNDGLAEIYLRFVRPIPILMQRSRYMFGISMLAAPVTEMGARNRTLYHLRVISIPTGIP